MIETGGVRHSVWMRVQNYSCVKDEKNIKAVSQHGTYGGVATVRRTLSLILLRNNFSSLLLAGLPVCVCVCVSGRTLDPHNRSRVQHKDFDLSMFTRAFPLLRSLR